MKRIISIFIIALLLTTTIHLQSTAQGCVAVRQMGGLGAMSPSGSYNLSKGDFQAGTNYRYFHSWRHFVGTDEQPQRQVLGNAVNIYSHAVDLNLSYGLTNRLQLNVTLPYVHNERSQTLTLNKDSASKKLTRYSVFAQGIADARLGLNYWVTDPAAAHTGNLMIGFGLKLATGSHNTTDNALQKDGTTKSAVNDQAIQPGDGGVGFSLEFQGFKKIYKDIYGFANGYYLFNPRESNGTYKSAAKAGLAGYNIYASPDQYFIRAGFMASVLKAKTLTFSLATRMEGIPAYDIIGGQVAYRRPGYVVAVESGVSYRMGQHSISLFVPYNFIKNRTQSAADKADQNLQNSKISDASKLVHVQGDAAFADYSISLGYSYRFAKNKKHA
ncbi:hypothetical protein QWZ08_27615 [Ferruginibacter paludis]|uniref:hypothetical protein n=1 Tax=Ferruginibacter paludis TaxID=1310417 RepID=UPI0025B35704|nr:hypothetical protein [Ferruginibacter paludis]MDN3659445.1 hypothetical protein [Ferruginibacter paludis]